MINAFISYDYELSWGTWDKLPLSYTRSHVADANKAAILLIKLHRKTKIPATWAIVGAMLDKRSPEVIMNNTKRSEKIKKDFSEFVWSLNCNDEKFFKIDKAVFNALVDDDLFEVGSHTYTHLYFLEENTTAWIDDFDQFEREYANAFGKLPVSVIFPKNQVNKLALDTAAQHSFKVVRLNEDNWLYRSTSRGKIKRSIIRILRYLDAYLPLQEFFTNTEQSHNLKITDGQYFFRPALNTRIQDFFHFLRLAFAINYCIFRGHNFHVWSHPHNFGGDLNRSSMNATRLFEYLLKKQDQGFIQIKKMDELIKPIKQKSDL